MPTRNIHWQPSFRLELLVITDRQFAMARRHSWLRAAYVHDDIVKSILKDPAVASNSDLTIMVGTGTREIETPDAKIGANLFLDVIPDTPVSWRAHLGRSGIDDQEQLISYAPKTERFLQDVFDAKKTPSAKAD
jgi:hypothetical protein